MKEKKGKKKSVKHKWDDNDKQIEWEKKSEEKKWRKKEKKISFSSYIWMKRKVIQKCVHAKANLYKRLIIYMVNIK